MILQLFLSKLLDEDFQVPSIIVVVLNETLRFDECAGAQLLACNVQIRIEHL